MKNKLLILLCINFLISQLALAEESSNCLGMISPESVGNYDDNRVISLKKDTIPYTPKVKKFVVFATKQIINKETARVFTLSDILNTLSIEISKRLKVQEQFPKGLKPNLNKSIYNSSTVDLPFSPYSLRYLWAIYLRTLIDNDNFLTNFQETVQDEWLQLSDNITEIMSAGYFAENSNISAELWKQINKRNKTHPDQNMTTAEHLVQYTEDQLANLGQEEYLKQILANPDINPLISGLIFFAETKYQEYYVETLMNMIVFSQGENRDPKKGGEVSSLFNQLARTTDMLGNERYFMLVKDGLKLLNTKEPQTAPQRANEEEFLTRALWENATKICD